MKEIIFSQNTSPIIVKIADQYKLIEDTNEFKKKISANQLLNTGIMLKLSEDVISGKIRKEELSLYMQNNLNIKKDVSEKVSSELINKVITLGKIVTTDEENYAEEKIDFNNTGPITKNTSPIKKVVNEIKEKPDSKIPQKRNVSETIVKKARKPKSSSDKYREPIE